MLYQSLCCQIDCLFNGRSRQHRVAFKHVLNGPPFSQAVKDDPDVNAGTLKRRPSATHPWRYDNMPAQRVVFISRTKTSFADNLSLPLSAGVATLFHESKYKRFQLTSRELNS